MVIWLLGISGAGKTTIGRKLSSYYNSIGKVHYLIDGDEIRNLFDNDLGYSIKERKENIKRIILGAYLLDKTNCTAIVCNISPFEELRKLAREKIKGYHEIYLKKNLQSSIKHDIKHIYAKHIGKTDIIGLDIPFEEPEHPNLALDTDILSEEDTLQALIQYLSEIAI